MNVCNGFEDETDGADDVEEDDGSPGCTLGAEGL